MMRFSKVLRISAVISMIASTTLFSGCQPEVVAQFDGKTLAAKIEVMPEQDLWIRTSSGQMKELSSGEIQVKFSIDHIGASSVEIEQSGKTFVIEIPKEKLEQIAFEIPSSEMNQPFAAIFRQVRTYLGSRTERVKHTHTHRIGKTTRRSTSYTLDTIASVHSDFYLNLFNESTGKLKAQIIVPGVDSDETIRSISD